MTLSISIRATTVLCPDTATMIYITILENFNSNIYANRVTFISLYTKIYNLAMIFFTTYKDCCYVYFGMLTNQSVVIVVHWR